MGELTDAPLRVLVIDDDPRLLASISDGLNLLAAYDVVQARDGIEGLERFFSEQPDCVVVDIRMPRLNGLQFLRAMRGDPDTADIPIIVLSALAQQDDELRGLFAGADAYLYKPVDIDTLLAAIQRALEQTAESRLIRWRRLAEQRARG